MQMGVTCLGGVANLKAKAICLKITGVTHLPARLSVKRRLIKDHHAAIAFAQLVNQLAVTVQTNNRALAVRTGIALKAGNRVYFHKAVVIQTKLTG